MELELRSDKLTVRIKEQGAEMRSVTDRAGVEFIWQAKKDVWPRHAPVLFPIVGKLKENKFNKDNCSFEMGQHGFARDKKFSVLKTTAESCILELKSSEDTKKIYPFDFSLRIGYHLSGNTLDTRYEVEN